MDITLYDETNHIKEEETGWMVDLLQLAKEKLDLEETIEVSITFVENTKIREINKEYRNNESVTDVISFAVEDDEDDVFRLLEIDEENSTRDLGDIFISYDKAVEQAEEYGHSLKREIGFLLVHGFLHLNGYDHMTVSEEKIMFGLQEEILDEYGLRR